MNSDSLLHTAYKLSNLPQLVSILIFFHLFLISNVLLAEETLEANKIEQKEINSEIRNIKEILNNSEKSIKELQNKIKIHDLKIYEFDNDLKNKNNDSFGKLSIAIVLSFISAWFGSWFAYLSTNRSRKKEAEIKKIDSTNELLLEAVNCLRELLSIKRNYIFYLTAHPVQRSLAMQPIIAVFRHSNPEISKLIFLEKIAKSPREKQASDIIFMKSTFDSYNTILEMLKTRNEKRVDIIQKVSQDLYANLLGGSIDQVTKEFFYTAGEQRARELVYLTEELIEFIDRTLDNLHSIIIELPNIAESLILDNVLKDYNKILKYELNKTELNILVKRVSVDEEIFDRITGKKRKASSKKK